MKSKISTTQKNFISVSSRCSGMISKSAKGIFLSGIFFLMMGFSPNVNAQCFVLSGDCGLVHDTCGGYTAHSYQGAGCGQTIPFSTANSIANFQIDAHFYANE